MRETQKASAQDDDALRMAVVSAGGHVKQGIPPFVKAVMDAAAAQQGSTHSEA